MRTVGILGGMGPEATVLLMQKIIAAVPARDDADHVPLIVDQNCQVPSRIAHLDRGHGAGPRAGAVLPWRGGWRRRGAEALAMPCNTAHHYADAIRGAVVGPVSRHGPQPRPRAARDAAGQGAAVGLLASPAVAQVALFDRALADVGLRVVHPEDGAALLAADPVDQRRTGPNAEAQRGGSRRIPVASGQGRAGAAYRLHRVLR